MLAIKISVYTGFIDIGNPVFRNTCNGLQIFGYFFSILFLISFCLFFRVIPLRFKAMQIACWLQPKNSAISAWYASGFSVTYAFKASDAIFRFRVLTGVSDKSPAAFFFNQRFNVYSDIPNAVVVSTQLCPFAKYASVRSRNFIS